MWKCSAILASIFLSVAAVQASEGTSENWPQWRGADFSGSTDSRELPVTWTNEENLSWSFELPGKGFSTPIVWGDQIIVTAPVDGRDGVLKLDLAGKLVWQKFLTPERSGRHRNASGCNPSPVTDGNLIFAYFKSGTLASLDFDGEVQWTTNLQDIFGEDRLYWDVGTSPVLTEDAVVATVMHSGKSGLVAFDKPTGRIVWQVDRIYETPTENSDSYTTPLVIEEGGKQIILVWGADHVTAHNVSDGGLLWSSAGFNPDQRQNWPSVASPVVAGDVLVVPYGRGAYLAGIRLGGSGDVTQSHRLWTREELGSFVPTPAVYDGKVYVLKDRGQILCIDPESGETLWTAEFPKHRSNYYASPLIAGDRLYAAREDGAVFVAQISDGFRLLSENTMSEKMIASPVPLANRLLLRGEQHLFVVGK
ncbi:MAG: PQQ-binding-like beta-propeller repeat protein [Acidobacteriota bacterium]|nr:MAG: PQQ-binding-like beta-propeller repeat protein [Acidobacteriota bacterium]